MKSADAPAFSNRAGKLGLSHKAASPKLGTSVCYLPMKHHHASGGCRTAGVVTESVGQRPTEETLQVETTFQCRYGDGPLLMPLVSSSLCSTEHDTVDGGDESPIASNMPQCFAALDRPDLQRYTAGYVLWPPSTVVKGFEKRLVSGRATKHKRTASDLTCEYCVLTVYLTSESVRSISKVKRWKNSGSKLDIGISS